MKGLLSIPVGGMLAAALFAAGKPNIVLIYVDDWAWNGSPVAMDASMANSRMPVLEMPNLEKLADEGMTFSRAYGSPQCAPARAAVQTGQSNPHNGYTLVLGKLQDDYFDTRPQYRNLPVVPTVSDQSLDADALTIPKALEPLGYVSAHLGKWHLYCDPGSAGYALHDGETTNNEGNTVGKVRNLPADLEDPKLMFSITDKGLGFMEEQVGKGNPFYLQLSHYAMHAGPETRRATQEKYERRPELKAYYEKNGTDPDELNRKGNPANWFGMGDDLDTNIGRVLDKLEELGIADNTYVIVVSDNGYREGSFRVVSDLPQPLHGRKWWAWDGGIRVPMIARGPGIKPGSVFEGNVVNYDFLPTFVEWAGGNPEALEDIDGVSLAGYMAGEQPDKDFLNRHLYFHVPHYRSEIPHSAIISGPLKVMHFYDAPDTPMLFNIAEDPGEVKNIARQSPETHKRLFDEMMRYFAVVDARLPKKNPDYDPEVYGKLKGYDDYIRLGAFEGERPLAADEK